MKGRVSLPLGGLGLNKSARAKTLAPRGSSAKDNDASTQGNSRDDDVLEGATPMTYPTFFDFFHKMFDQMLTIFLQKIWKFLRILKI